MAVKQNENTNFNFVSSSICDINKLLAAGPAGLNDWLGSAGAMPRHTPSSFPTRDHNIHRRTSCRLFWAHVPHTCPASPPRIITFFIIIYQRHKHSTKKFVNLVFPHPESISVSVIQHQHLMLSDTGSRNRVPEAPVLAA